ncbi:hypothetical protein BDZ89DRAFT_1128475 [Hymenopellis radicata]|nr:hypothetical protein BDZ89DRAFT_1128475 [Hymenopellis radicata]
MYKKYVGLSDIKNATQVLVELRGMVEDERPNTDVAFCLKLLNDDPMLFWCLKRLWTQRIPFVNEAPDHRPALILHDLGGFQRCPILAERLDDIFRPHNNTFLVNGSASGKTKLLYEGLCKHWGLFFTCAVDGSNLGSQDLVQFVRRFPAGRRPDNPDFAIISGDHPGLTPPSQRTYIHAMAHRFASEVLLARLLLFKAFLEVSFAKRAATSHRRLWLCFQLQAALLRGDFNDAIFLLRTRIQNANAENEFLDNAVRQTLEEIFQIWTPSAKESLFIAIDEANRGTEPSPILQDSEEDEEGIPALKELLRIWHHHTKEFNVTFVVAGVKIVPEYFSGAEWSSYRWSSNTGDFMESPALQEEYLRTIWWLRGRHRLTASFVTELLEQGFTTPHLYLNKYVNGFADFLLEDDRRFYESGPMPGDSPYDTGVLSDNPDPIVIASIHDALAIGRFIDTDMRQITIDEPLILLAAAQWFKENVIAISSLSYYRRPEFRPFRTITNATYFVLLTLFHVFTRPRRLADLFHFTRVPAWARRKAQLITLHRLSGRHLKWSYQSYLPGTCAQLVYVSDGVQDTERWFDNLGRDGVPPFCVHAISTAPTLIFPLYLDDNTAVWIALEVLMHATDDVADIIRQMHPEHMLKPSSPDTSGRRSSVTKHFQQLPSRRTDIGKYSLIRVVAPLYDDIKTDGSNLSTQEPCAVFDVSKLDEMSFQMPSVDDLFRDVAANASGVSHFGKMRAKRGEVY